MKTIEWLLNHPPTGSTKIDNDGSYKCDYCGATIEEHLINMSGHFCICVKCVKKAL